MKNIITNWNELAEKTTQKPAEHTVWREGKSPKRTARPEVEAAKLLNNNNKEHAEQTATVASLVILGNVNKAKNRQNST